VLEGYTDGGLAMFETIQEMAAYNGVPVPEGDERVQCCGCGHQGLLSWWEENDMDCPSCGMGEEITEPDERIQAFS